VDRKLGNIDGGVTRTPAVSESAIGEKKFWCGSCGESRSEQGACVLFRSADLPCAFWQEGRSSVKVRLIRKVAANLRQPKCDLRQESARSCEMSPLPDLSLLPRPILYGRAVERSDGRFQAPVSRGLTRQLAIDAKNRCPSGQCARVCKVIGVSESPGFRVTSNVAIGENRR
jgi:hypothetical protein